MPCSKPGKSEHPEPGHITRVKPPRFALGPFSAEQFLRDYWQKKPLLIRQALPGFMDPLTRDEIAGLACDEQVESRLIVETREVKNPEAPGWQLQQGPFEASALEALPDSHWTLHIQGVDQYVADVYRLLDYFRFIPNWRIDDVMVSYSPDAGSAGPHFDQYDVFLLQGAGKKRWEIGQKCDASTELVTGLELSIIRDFQVTDDWLVNPGDVLYIPPQYAHYGVACGHSTTYSVGFRAPGFNEILGEFSFFQGQRLSAHQRYQDTDLLLQDNPGEISEQAIDKMQQILLDQVSNREAIAQWLGEYVTEEKNPGEEILPEKPLDTEQFIAMLTHAGNFHWNEGARFAYIEKNDAIGFYINGRCFNTPNSTLPCIKCLCSSTSIAASELAIFLQNPESTSLLCQLYNQGFCYYS